MEEDEAAVDERPEIRRPAHAHFIGLHVLASGETHAQRVVLLRHREQLVPAREVDDLAVIDRDFLRHGGPT
jgi:hypothetical protein